MNKSTKSFMILLLGGLLALCLNPAAAAQKYVPGAPGWSPPGFSPEQALEPSGLLDEEWVLIGKYLYNKATDEWQIPVNLFEVGVLVPLDEETTNDFFSQLKVSLSCRFWTAPDSYLLIGGRSLFLTGAFGESGGWGTGIDITAKKTNVDDDGRLRVGVMYMSEKGGREARFYCRRALSF